MAIGLLLLIIAGCTNANPNDEATPTPTVTPLPPPEIFVTETPDVSKAVESFLAGWAKDDFQGMYAMLSADSQAIIDEESFVKRYQDVANETAMSELLYEIVTANTLSTKNAEAIYRVNLRSAIVGDIEREMVMPLVREDGQWRVIWNDGMILPELSGGNYLRMDRETPIRATIYDRNGIPLASQEQAVAIGLYPDFVDLEDDNGLVGLISTLTNIRSNTLFGWISEAEPGAYLPLGEISVDRDPGRLDILRSYGAVVTADYTARLYYRGGAAPHLIGYVSAIQRDELDQYRRLGYSGNERVGRDGIELWGDSMLSGVRGGTLYVFDPEGKVVSQLGSASSQPGDEIYSTIEGDFHYEVQKAMSVFSGAIVVLERDSGRVLAIVSSPGFNPNAYVTENSNWNILIENILEDPNTPHFNRATNGQYPLGSVFKVITLSAALESGRYTEDSTYECGYVFEELAGFPRYDWTYEDFLEDEVTRPSGLLTLPEGLVRSCNPYFWHMGLDLYNAGLTTAISDMAQGFGLGSITEIEVVEERPGQIPEPESPVDAINLAIGQGDMLVTPIQVARFMAAIGNGGTLYRPQALEQIDPAIGDLTTVFSPEAQGTLPISEETLRILQGAMVGVVRSQNPVGTAYPAFTGLNIAIAGKTGTATVGDADPHAWFAGYTFEGREDKPDIAIAVIAENAGEGSEVAAPIFRRVVELYFYGAPRKLYRWEAYFDITKSPTLPITETPTSQIPP